ncbi:DNA primase family protein [Paraburkholderia bannensis]|uniref:DNA primase family protein n=1 Tax=Paraburkholderia bannensis TaxID=765414 RepID=UPI002AB7E974|nr:phage/plasmid primase, P4 family [Paraburkholderia bannensis]
MQSQETDLEVTLSTFNNHFKSEGFETGTCTIDEFFTIFEEGHTIRKAKNGPAFNFNLYSDTTSRENDNITEIGGITLDIDRFELAKLPALLERLKRYKSVCHTTYGHRADKPRLRIVLPLPTPIEPELYEEYARRVAQHLDVQCDECSFKIGQIYYLPAHPESTVEEGHFVQSAREGAFIAPNSLPPTIRKKRKGFGTSASDQEKDTNQLALADTIIDNDFNGHIMVVAGEVFEYAEGHWKLVRDDVFARRISELPAVEAIYETAAQVDSLLRAIKLRCTMPAFPNATLMTINVQNGVLDLNTGKLGPHRPEHFHRNQLKTSYDASSQCPRWLQFLDEVFSVDPDRQEKINFLQEWFGYLLVPSTAYQKMLWLLGPGANGKSALLEVMQDMLGEENSASMMLSEMSGEYYRQQLQGKLANFAGEHPTGARLNDGFIKSVVAGDSITANRKGLTLVQFRPTARIIAAMNELPTLRDISHGFFRRLIVLTLNRTFTKKEQNHKLSDELKSERAGVLAWAVQGLLRLQQQTAFTTVPSSVTLCDQYQYESDPIAMYVRDCLTARPDAKTVKKEVYEDYRNYCIENGYQPVANSLFGKTMKAKGIGDRDSNGKAYYCVAIRGSTSKAPKKLTLNHVIGEEESEAVV